MDYSNIIRKIRENMFLTQKEFADLIGVSFETVNRWENCKFNPSMKIKKRIHEFCQKNNIDLAEK